MTTHPAHGTQLLRSHNLRRAMFVAWLTTCAMAGFALWGAIQTHAAQTSPR